MEGFSCSLISKGKCRFKYVPNYRGLSSFLPSKFHSGLKKKKSSILVCWPRRKAACHRLGLKVELLKIKNDSLAKSTKQPKFGRWSSRWPKIATWKTTGQRSVYGRPPAKDRYLEDDQEDDRPKIGTRRWPERQPAKDCYLEGDWPTLVQEQDIEMCGACERS